MREDDSNTESLLKLVPPEIVSYMLSFLNIRELVGTHRVSKRFRLLAKTAFLQNQMIFLDPHRQLNLLLDLLQFVRSRPKLTLAEQGEREKALYDEKIEGYLRSYTKNSFIPFEHRAVATTALIIKYMENMNPPPPSELTSKFLLVFEFLFSFGKPNLAKILAPFVAEAAGQGYAIFKKGLS